MVRCFFVVCKAHESSGLVAASAHTIEAANILITTPSGVASHYTTAETAMPSSGSFLYDGGDVAGSAEDDAQSGALVDFPPSIKQAYERLNAAANEIIDYGETLGKKLNSVDSAQVLSTQAIVDALKNGATNASDFPVACEAVIDNIIAARKARQPGPIKAYIKSTFPILWPVVKLLKKTPSAYHWVVSHVDGAVSVGRSHLECLSLPS